MSFTSNIPNVGQSLGQTRDNIRNNFTNYSTVIAVDHLGPNGGGAGQHKQVTLNTYGAAPFAVTGAQSYISSFNATAAGSQLVYQPSVVNINVPVSPRALARVNWNGAAWVLGNGPYGAGTNFNAGSISGSSASGFTLNFAQPFPTTDYFVIALRENVNNSGLGITSKTTGSIVFLATGVAGVDVIILVY